MLMKDITSHLDKDKREKLGEVLRFGIVGGVATLIQYGVYLLLLQWTSAGVANTVGYAVSFCFNFYASTHFTFHVKANVKHGPIPMFCVCVPVNFLLVRFFLKR